MKMQMETVLRAGLGGALLASSAACGGDLGAGSEGGEDTFLDQEAEAADGFDSADGPAEEDVLEKGLFPNTTFNGFNVACTSPQQQQIQAAEARAKQVLAIAMPATANARVNRNTESGRRFRDNFVPGGNLNPDPNRTSPDAWDRAANAVGQKLAKISQILNNTTVSHTCHADNESIRRENNVFKTCGETLANASTDFNAGPTTPIRWCIAHLPDGTPALGLTLLHELAHQDRTADATGIRVLDLASTAPPGLNNVQSYVTWLRNNQP